MPTAANPEMTGNVEAHDSATIRAFIIVKIRFSEETLRERVR
jgi:hypothetical protein